MIKEKHLNDLLGLSPAQGRLLVVIGSYPYLRGSPIGKKAKIARSSIFTHLHRLRDMDYIKQIGYTYVLSDLGQAVINAAKIFQEERDEHTKTNQSAISNHSELVVSSDC